MLFVCPAFAVQNVVIVVDDSGSMDAYMDQTTTRMAAAKESLKQVVESLPDDTRLGVVALNGNWNPENWLIPFDRINKTIALSQIEKLYTSGGTPLGEVMKIAADQLLADRAKNGYGIYKLLVITDGEANDANLVAPYVQDIKNRGLIIDAIGVDMAEDHSLATQVHSYHRANSKEQLTEAISATFAETSDSDKNAADDDFALLAGLPDELPPKIISALMVGNNAPIGTVPVPVVNEDGKMQFDQHGALVVAPVDTSGGWFGLILIGVVVVVILAGIILIIGANS